MYDLHELSKTTKLGSQTSPSRLERTQGSNLVSSKVSSNKRTDDRTTERPDDKPTNQKVKRIKVRYAFEFYQDQIARLKEMKKMAYINDIEFNMSEVLREALDKYLERGIDRTDER